MPAGKRILSDFKVFSRGYLRNRFGLFFGLIFPVILILIFGAIFSGNNSGTINVYAQNLDTGPFSAQFLAAINKSSTIRAITVDDKGSFSQYLAAHSSSDGILLPQNFSDNFVHGRPVDVTVYGNPTSSTSGIVTATVGGIVSYFNLYYYNLTYNLTAVPIINVTTATVNTSQTKYVDFLIPGLVGFSILVNPMFSLVNISSEYKKYKLFKQLSLTPLRKMEWLTSKIMWYIVLSVASFLLMVGVGVLAFGAHVTLNGALIPFLLLGPTLFASLGMLVGTVTKDPETAGVIGNIVTFPMMFLSGTFFPISIMPMYLQNIAHILPLFYIVEGLNNVMVYGNFTGAIIDLAVIAIITSIFFILAVRLFKWRED